MVRDSCDRHAFVISFLEGSEFDPVAARPETFSALVAKLSRQNTILVKRQMAGVDYVTLDDGVVSLRKNDGRVVLEMAYETWQKLEEAAENSNSETGGGVCIGERDEP